MSGLIHSASRRYPYPHVDATLFTRTQNYSMYEKKRRFRVFKQNNEQFANIQKTRNQKY